jgi:hypothetical protein
VEGSSDREALQFTLNDVPVTKDRGLLIQFEIRSEKMQDFDADVARIVNATPRGLLGWSTTRDFTPVSFYFREPTADVRMAIEFTIQGLQPVSIRNFTIRDTAEVLARQYEHGVVLCNPNERTPWSFDLSRLFPGVALRRIASSDYDKHMAVENNGTKVGAAVTLNPQTGLFLVKTKP